jgi:hypothetical protein
MEKTGTDVETAHQRRAPESNASPAGNDLEKHKIKEL